MKTETRNWDCVNVDSYIQDARGVVWRIAAIDETEATEGTTGAFRAKNTDDVWADIAPKPLEAPVTIVFPEDEAEPLVALLRDQLGAQVLGVKDHATGSVSCAPWPETAPSKNLDEWRQHLEILHGMYVGDVKGYARLVEAHNAAHSEAHPHTGNHVNHTH